MEKNFIVKFTVDAVGAIAQIGKLASTIFSLQQSLSAVSTPFKALVSDSIKTSKYLFENAQNINAIAMSLKGLANPLISTASMFETLHTQLYTVFQSSAKANVELAKIAKMAAETPFGVDELSTAFQRLAARGITPTVKQMTAFSDVAAAQGKGMVQLAEAIMDAATGEFERMKEVGLRFEKHGNKIGTTFKGIKYEAELSMKGAMDIMRQIGESKGIAGGSARLAETMTGSISNLKDSFTLLYAELGKHIRPIVKEIAEILQYFTKQLRDNSGVVKEYVIYIRDWIHWLFENRTAILALIKVYGFLSVAFGVVKAALILMVQNFIFAQVTMLIFGRSMNAIQLLFFGLGKAITGIGFVMQSFTTGLMAVNKALQLNVIASQLASTSYNALKKVIDIVTLSFLWKTRTTTADTIATDVNTASVVANSSAVKSNNVLLTIWNALKATLTVTTTGLTYAVRGLWTVIASNPMTALATVLASVTAYLLIFGKTVTEVAEKLEELDNKLSKSTDEMHELTNAVKEQFETFAMLKPEKYAVELEVGGKIIPIKESKKAELRKDFEEEIGKLAKYYDELYKKGGKEKKELTAEEVKFYSERFGIRPEILRMGFKKTKDDLRLVSEETYASMMEDARTAVEKQMETYRYAEEKLKKFFEYAKGSAGWYRFPYANFDEFLAAAKDEEGKFYTDVLPHLEGYKEIWTIIADLFVTDEADIMAKPETMKKMVKDLIEIPKLIEETKEMAAKLRIDPSTKKIKGAGKSHLSVVQAINEEITDVAAEIRANINSISKSLNEMTNVLVLEREEIEYNIKKVNLDPTLQQMEKERNSIQQSMDVKLKNIAFEKELADEEMAIRRQKAKTDLELDYFNKMEKMNLKLKEQRENLAKITGAPEKLKQQKEIAEQEKNIEQMERDFYARQVELSDLFHTEMETSDYKFRVKAEKELKESLNERILYLAKYYETLYNLEKENEKKLNDLRFEKARRDREEQNYMQEGRYGKALKEIDLQWRLIEMDFRKAGSDEIERMRLRRIERAKDMQSAIDLQQKAVELAKAPRGKFETEADYVKRTQEVERLEKELAQIKEKYRDITEQEEEEHKLKMEAIEKDYFKKRRDLNVEAVKFGLDAFKTLYTEAFKVADAFSKAEVASLQKSIDARKEWLNTMKDALKSGGEEARRYTAKQVAMEEERIDNLEKLKEKEIGKQKIFAETSLILNTMIGISNLLASPVTAATGGIFLPVQIGLMLASMLAGLAASRAMGSSAVQGLEKGGLMEGPSHREGGIQTYLQNGRHAGYEIEGGEFVVNKKSTRQHLNLLKAINDNRLDALDINKVNKPLELSKKDFDFSKKDKVEEKLDRMIILLERNNNKPINIKIDNKK